MIKQNGQTATPKPALVIYWDNENQCYNFAEDREQLKNPEMVLAVLGMCHEKAKFNVNAINAQVLQQQMMARAQEQAIKQRIIQGG